MKNIKIIFVFFTVFFGSMKANAQYQGTYIGFEVVGSSALMVNQNATSTTFNIKIFVSRFYGTGGYQPFYMNFKLGIENGAVFTNVYTITSSDFQTGQGNAEKQFSVTLQNSSLPHGKSLLIHYNNPSNSNPSYTASYNPKVSIFNPPPVVVVPAITNNVITVQDDGFNYGYIAGSQVSGGNGIYAYQWQQKTEGGTFINYDSNYLNDINKYMIYKGGITVRRVITSGNQTSYSNEIALVKPPVNNFTVSKTPVYDNNGVLIGNNMKILLATPDTSIRFIVTGLPMDDGPFQIYLNNNLEFFVPHFINESLIFGVWVDANTGSRASIPGTWSTSSSDQYIY